MNKRLGSFRLDQDDTLVRKWKPILDLGFVPYSECLRVARVLEGVSEIFNKNNRFSQESQDMIVSTLEKMLKLHRAIGSTESEDGPIIRGLDIINDIERLAVVHGVNVERSKMPIHIRYTSSGNDKDAHLLCMKAMREIGSLEDFVGTWDKDYTLFLYEAYVNPGDELITIRCARDKVTDAEFDGEDHGE